MAVPQQMGTWLSRPEWEWSRGAQGGSPTREPREFKLLARWSDELHRGSSVVASARSLAAGERTAHNLTSFGALSITPLRSRAGLVGALVLEHSDAEPPWSSAELAALRTLATAATAAGRVGERSGQQTHDPKNIFHARDEALLARESMAQRALNSLPQRVAWKDRQLRYAGCNRAMARALGFVSPSQIVGKLDEELGWHAERGAIGERARASERAVLERGEAGPRERRRDEAPAGAFASLDITRAPLIDERGKVEGVVVLYDDVTSEAEAAKLLNRARRLEALGTFAAGVDHDLEAECSELRAAIERGRELRAGDDAGELEEVFDGLERVSRRVAALGRQLRNFAGRQLITPTGFSLPSLLEGLKGQLMRTIGDAAALVIETPEMRCHVTADPRQIEQLLINLVANARDAIVARGDERGEILVQMIPTTLAPARARALELAPGEFIALRVRDSGEGLSAEAVDRAFDPYRSTRAARRGALGMGLGLAVAHAIARNAGGLIRVSSERDAAGLELEVLLPRAYRDAPKTPSPVTRGAETIAVLIANTTLRQASASLLRSLGYRVITGGSLGALASRVSGAEREPVQLVVTDVSAREGVSALARELRELLPGARLVALSSRRDAPSSAPGDGSRDIVLLYKPFSLEELAQTLRDALDQRA